MDNFGFFKVATAIPALKVADCEYNLSRIVDMMQQAADRGASVVVFPELSLTSATCGDLFLQSKLLEQAEMALCDVAVVTSHVPVAAIVGLPMQYGDKIYNCAAVVASGEVLGIVPKSYLDDSGDSSERRYFASGFDVAAGDKELATQDVLFGAHQLFMVDGVCFGVEIGADMFAPVAPSAKMSLGGAKLIFNLSSRAESVSKHNALVETIKNQSLRSHIGYIYASSGVGESTANSVYAGDAIIAENGHILAQSERFAMDEQLVVADIDLEILDNARKANGVFSDGAELLIHDYNETELEREDDGFELLREVDPMPFVPACENKRKEHCQEIFEIQTLGLAKRLKHTNSRCAVIGISGGLDSTLALLVTVHAFDRLGLDRKGVVGITMPGFGTTDRTYNNAVTLIKELGITFKEISIAAACRQHFADIGLPEGDRSVTYENSQARERTQILMDVANMMGGLVIGTGDMSELALGWATYNGDQMSMYGVNCSVPKTLVRHMVEWYAKGEKNPKVAAALLDVVATPVSPELLPADEKGDIAQKTEDLVGPYELHDFFIYHFVGNGFTPSKILFLAQQAFKDKYDRATILKWMRTFFWRFFTQQFKRSASPDGPKVGGVSLSAKDWRMPSDACAAMWIKECEMLAQL